MRVTMQCLGEICWHESQLVEEGLGWDLMDGMGCVGWGLFGDVM